MNKASALILALAVPGVILVGCSKKTPSAENETDSSSTQVTVLDEGNFDAEIAHGVVLVDFWATWCGPCKMQGPIVEEVAAQVQDAAKVAKLDVDAVPSIAQRYNVRNIPTLIVFKNGKKVQQFVGVTQAEKLVSVIQAQLDAKG